MGTEIFKKVYPCRKHIKRFPVGKKVIRHLEPCQINYLRPVKPAAANLNLPGPGHYATLRRTEDLAPVWGSSLQGNLLGGQEPAAAKGAH